MVRFVLLAAMLVLLPQPRLPAAEPPLSETQKIERLIAHVGQLEKAKFVRNGVEYDAASAAKFMRAKWEAMGADIKTAAEFIEKIASKSSTTGKPYLIRFTDGKERKSGEYLTEQLQGLEAKPE
jgi:hypothetical protein